MGRIRRYESNAERQRAYRERIAAEGPAREGPQPAAPARRRRPSRPARLAAAMDQLQMLQQEYEHWLESLPEPLQESDQGDRLTEVVEQLQAALDMLTEVDPPRGFGRD